MVTMKARVKTRGRLLEELEQLRARVARLQTAAADRERARSALEESEARFRRLFDSDLVGMIFADVHGNVAEANDFFLKMVGYGRDDLPLRWDLMTPPEWRDSGEVQLDEIVKTGAPSEKEFIRRDGSRIPVLIGGALLYGSEEDCVGIVLDLTEHKKAEVALRESEERYRILYDNIPLMYFTLDAEGIILSVNSLGAAELGYSQEELVGRNVLEVFHPEDHQAVTEQFEKSVRKPGRVARWEFRKVRKDGSILWVHEAASTVGGDDDRPVVLVVCEDVTEQKQAEKQLLEHKQQLQNLTSELSLAEERERRRIATGLHDQIGQTLAIVQMRLGELGGAARDDDARRQIAELRELVDQSVGAIRSLTFELSSPLLYELGLEAALQALTEQVGERHAITCTFDTDPLPKPLTDDSNVVLYHVVRELLFNVVKHSEARRARVTVRATEGNIRITVRDDGVGIDTTGFGETFGSSGGFGLFSIHERLNHLGGSLAIESDSGNGTRVVVTAPLNRADLPPE